MMKLKLTLAVWLVAAAAFGQGIEFFHGTYEQACEKAKKENKNIFIDVYTTWCGPCKKMARDVFPVKEVGDFYNKNFVCIKLDAENEADSEFFKHYKASAYPTYFWVTPETKLMDTKTGMSSPETFIQYGKEALQSNLEEEARILKEQWEGGDHSYEMVQKYVLGVLSVTEPAKVFPTVCAYVEELSPEEIKTKETYAVLRRFMRGTVDNPFPDNVIFNTFIANAEYYASLTSTSNIYTGSHWKTMYTNFVRIPMVSYKKALDKGKDGKAEMEHFEKTVKKLQEMDFVYKDMFLDCIETEKLLFSRDYKKGITSMEKLYEKYGEEYPFMYGMLLYTLSYNQYFLEGKGIAGDKIVDFATTYLHKVPCKETLMYYALSLKNVDKPIDAMNAMAWMDFYPQPKLSNAYYKYFGFDNIREKFPY